MLTDQDMDIIISLINSKDALSVYRISKDSGISSPQVAFRLSKLIPTGLVKSVTVNDKTKYTSHPLLRSRKSVEAITNKIADIVDLIDEIEKTEPEQMKHMLLFIIERTEIESMVTVNE